MVVTPTLAEEKVNAAWIEMVDGVPVAHRAQIAESRLEEWEKQHSNRPGTVGAGRIGQRHLLEVASPGSDPFINKQWALTRLDVEALDAVGADGTGIVVAVLDPAVDANHPQWAGRVLSGFDVYDAKSDGRIDPNGHGTHVAGIIAAAADGVEGRGLAPGVSILPVRVLDASGSADDADVARGVVWATAHGAQIISMSLGGYDPNPLLASAIADAVASGIAVVVAAGNSGPFTSPTVYPAANPGALGVAATSGDDQAAWFSTRGNWVDIAAPGVGILSTWPGGGWEIESGTSMATPYVSAAIALVAQGSKISVLEAQKRLVESATDIAVGDSNAAGDGGVDLTGVGLTDPLAALKGLGPRRVSQRAKVPAGSLPELVKVPTLELPKLVMPTLPPITTPEIPKPGKPVLVPFPVTPNPVTSSPTPDRPGSNPITPNPVTSSPTTTVKPVVNKSPSGRDGKYTEPVKLSIERSADGNVVVRLRIGQVPSASTKVRVTTGGISRWYQTDRLGRVVLGKTRSAVRVAALGRQASIAAPAGRSVR